MIVTLCECLDTLDEPEARAAMVWVIGEYAERIDNADELLEGFLEVLPCPASAALRAWWSPAHGGVQAAVQKSGALATRKPTFGLVSNGARHYDGFPSLPSCTLCFPAHTGGGRHGHK